jgi:acyl-CoA synthetase (AMP-forming)/AMP-acid ligase II
VVGAGATALDRRLRAAAGEEPDRPALQLGGQSGAWLTRRELDAVTTSLARTVTAAVDGYPSAALLVGVRDRGISPVHLIAALRMPLPVIVTPTAAGSAARQLVTEALTANGIATVHWSDPANVRVTAPGARDGGRALPAESLVLPSSGSTGRPRLVVNGHIRTAPGRPAATRIVARLGWQPGQRQLVVGPLVHASSLTFFVEGVADSNEVVVLEDFRPAAVLDAIERQRIEWAQLTPYYLDRMRKCDAEATTDLSSLGALLHTSAACPPAVKRHWHARLGADRVYEQFGSSEGIGATVARGDEWEKRPGTVGRGVFTQIRILDERGRPLPAGEVGEIYFRSPGIREDTYLDSSVRMRTTLDGFASIGDRGWLDHDGYLYPTDRQLDRITVAGTTVVASEVEAVLAEHPSVLDVGVGSVPDPRLGRRVVALVVPRAGEAFSPRELRTWLRSRLDAAAVPRQIVPVPLLSRTEVGKLLRNQLDDQITRALPMTSATSDTARRERVS